MSYSILGRIAEVGRKLPLCLFQVPAGFPSPAADHIEAHISLDEVLNIRAPHVYLVKITGESMQGAGIFDGDLAVVDRSLEPAHGHIVVALLNNDPLCKRLCIRGKDVILLSENPKYPPRYVLEGDELAIWGVIIGSVRSHV
ncbi:translesion error-prone DNA polymerase V autoproteolytic subunit [Pseudomonas sp. TH49]|jgi:DNA polymerase V|uniref:LexA family protein n=1 Tax=Pseudomonas TaxID=286 RepID=UPI00054C2979|nr:MULTISPECIES: S24 family peptidase [Pseudomonas]KII31924.1 peptidase S24 [Pseudomonas fluorescens]MBK5345543.1 translesion error-prone DNA polymerase V autoproteolytic subunit [Pseudomonas sp. TH49]WET12948.1 S24 family peptidase [Pseudomonas sp. D3]VVO65267.1 Protein UmuD [Pseudomonas fluorescens]